MSEADIVTVLVVDDEALIRFELADVLADHGFAGPEAGGADEAIAVMEAEDRVRIVITDIDMPGSMDGIRLPHFIRERCPPPPCWPSRPGSTSVPAPSLLEQICSASRPTSVAFLAR